MNEESIWCRHLLEWKHSYMIFGFLYKDMLCFMSVKENEHFFPFPLLFIKVIFIFLLHHYYHYYYYYYYYYRKKKLFQTKQSKYIKLRAHTHCNIVSYGENTHFLERVVLTHSLCTYIRVRQQPYEGWKDVVSCLAP